MAAKDTQVGGDHYKKMGDFQPWEVLKAWLTPEEFKGYMKGTAIAYLAREAEKGGAQDIAKSAHTLAALVEMMQPPAPADVGLEFPLGTEFLVGQDVARGLQTDGVGGVPVVYDTWILHADSVRPVGPVTIVDVRLRDGQVITGHRAGELLWSKINTGGDIAEYKVIRNG